MKYLIAIIYLFLLSSCIQSQKGSIALILQDWENKKIIFPVSSTFTIQGKDTIDFYGIKSNSFKILMYVDSIGCTQCKLQLPAWKKFINQVDSISTDKVQFLFFFFPKRKSDLHSRLSTDSFKYPICIDEKDSLNRLNKFPSKMEFQTFLLNNENKVIAIGNPIFNPKIKELYLNILSGNNYKVTTQNPETNAILSEQTINWGTFPWKEEQQKTVILKNTGNTPLIINDITTSCGCTKVEHDTKPIVPKDSTIIKITYKADQPEHFNKTITVYCNAKGSPFQLKISGNAKE